MAEKIAKTYIVYDFIYITAGIPGVIFFRPKNVYASPEAKERIKGGAIVTANHSGLFDPVYLMMSIRYRRHHFVCLDSFFEGRFRGWLFSQFHCIPINRENFSMAQLKRITGELDQGRMVTMFPEGHVSGGQLSPFKSGVILMALRSGKPIVPVYTLPRKHWYSRLVTFIGEKYSVVDDIGQRPAMGKIDEAARKLEARERALQEMAAKYVARREKH